jgi:hypothetical protein
MNVLMGCIKFPTHEIFATMTDMEHDKLHQLAVKSGYITSCFLNKLTIDGRFCDAELRKFAVLLIDDIFDKINDISKQNGLVDNHTLRQKIHDIYKRD